MWVREQSGEGGTASGRDEGGMASRRTVAESSECRRRLAGATSLPYRIVQSSNLPCLSCLPKNFFHYSRHRPRPPRWRPQTETAVRSPSAVVIGVAAVSIKFCGGTAKTTGRARPLGYSTDQLLK